MDSSLELKAVGAVFQMVEDGIGQDVITDTGIPLIGRQLADHQYRAVPAPPRLDRIEVVSAYDCMDTGSKATQE